VGLLIALSVFVYPPALPFLTLGLLFFVASSLPRGVPTVAARAVLVLPGLVAALGPGVVSTGSGSFLLPWWLHVAVGHTGVDYYVIEYALACAALLPVLVLTVAAWRGISNWRKARGPGATRGRRAP
jgi:hypothetical protein